MILNVTKPLIILDYMNNEPPRQVFKNMFVNKENICQTEF